MVWGRRVVAATAVLLALALAGCAPATADVLAGSSVTVAYDAAFTSLNASASPTMANRELAEAVLGGFSTVNGAGQRVPDRSFGSIAVLSRDPLTVRYTVADGVRWSDGAPVDAVDLLLAWAAESGEFPAFAATRSALGLALSSALPSLSEDRKSLTVVFDVPFADYAAQFAEVLPAHVAAREAIGAASTDVAKDEVIDAVTRASAGDTTDLDRIATWWSTGFAIDAGPAVLVTDGPYRIASVRAGAEVVLVPDPGYVGDHRPGFATVRLVTLSAAAALQGIGVGEVQVASLAVSIPTRALVASVDPPILAGGDAAARIVVVTRPALRGVGPQHDGTGLLWNVWDWRPAR